MQPLDRMVDFTNSKVKRTTRALWFGKANHSATAGECLTILYECVRRPILSELLFLIFRCGIIFINILL